MIEGVDVSRHQAPGHCDWAEAAAAGLAFAWVKTTEGMDYTDPEAQAHLEDLSRTRVLRGGYHFGRPDNRFRESSDGIANGTTEGNWAARRALDFGAVAGCLPLVLDLEKYTDSGTVEQGQRNDYVRGFLLEAKRLTGVLPVVYAGPVYWGYQQGDAFAAELHELGVPLWMVKYGGGADPIDSIPGWPWMSWQWSGGGDSVYADPWPGLPHPIDRNRYRGTLAELRALVN